MAGKNTGVPIEEHPLLRNLRRHGTTARVFFGYVGSTDGNEHVELYPSLYDLSQSIRIPRADILHAEEAPAQVMPFGGTVLWVRADATLVRRREENVADVHGTPTPSAESGRLRIGRRARLRMERADDWDPNCTSCHSPCSTCHTDCSICVSTCQVQLPQVQALRAE
ncbi:hypothetical protein [Streptomyces diastatochromogenes]|uniref:Uncharacterized protein n=1 Tax=Streptomyces diastatochromogenes TaxID=42236 RepID=A0A233SSE3_STRDA|nr:hypothetical protein [Streptomyces diastatochromogenes]MCZ0987457.1 hypothetical protein [Streptomyces diastatochromogenes]OXY98546.1 hypothetical protein BEK98_06795 [Streptomyces diastatochromogenes]